MKLVKIVDAYESLMAIGNIELNATESFKWYRLYEQVEKLAINYHQQRDKLLIKYGKSDDGKNYSISKENAKDFQKELTDLCNLEVDLEFEKIKILKTSQIKPVDLLRTIDFIEMEGD